MTTSSRSTPVIVTSKLDDVASHKEVLPKLSESETPAAIPQNKCTIENVNPAYESLDMSNKHASLCPKPSIDNSVVDEKASHTKDLTNTNVSEMVVAINSLGMLDEMASPSLKIPIDNAKAEYIDSNDGKLGKVADSPTPAVTSRIADSTEESESKNESLDISYKHAPTPKSLHAFEAGNKVSHDEINARSIGVKTLFVIPQNQEII